jgi:tetratricopeptide (TPR) repeat protein
MDTKQVIARFEAERQALAHDGPPNIAKVLDAGTRRRAALLRHGARQGRPITEYCDTGEALDTPSGSQLFTDVCRAIQHAHQKGIIHRDLKPSNVLVTLHDGVPVPKVIDFGIAKATDHRLTEKTLFTEFRQVVGTPEYMAPEQAEMSGPRHRHAGDIYSLGVLLYELLTGTTPFDLKSLLREGLRRGPPDIREVEPPKPSTKLSTLGEQLPVVAKRRHTAPNLLGRILRGDLDWIVLKALEKDRSRRYETATAFADDIARYLTDRPVLAGPPSRLYRLRKYVRRHRAGVAAAAAVLLALVGGVLLAFASWRDASRQAKAATAARTVAARERDEARAQADKARKVLAVTRGMLGAADPYQAPVPDYTVRQLVLDFEDGLGDRLAGQPEVEAAIRITIATTLLELSLFDEAERSSRRVTELVGGIERPDPELVSDARLLEAMVATHRGRHAEAERTIREVLTEAVRRQGPYHLNVATLRHRLSSVLLHLGRYEEAEAISRAAIDVLRRLGAEGRTVLAAALTGLAHALNSQDRYAEAEPVLREVSDLHRSLSGPDSLPAAAAMDALATVLQRRDRPVEAVELLERCLEIRRKHLPEGHVLIGYALNQLGACLLRCGEKERAERCLTEAEEIYRRHLPEGHPARITVLNNLAMLVKGLGERANQGRAVELMREVLRQQIAARGPDHPQTCPTRISLGNGLWRIGRLDEAERVLREGLAVALASLGEEHGYVAALHANLASVHRRRGEPRKALEHDVTALEIRERLFDEDHNLVIESLVGVGNGHRALNAPEKARPYFRRAGERLRRQAGRDDPLVAHHLYNLALALWAIGDAEDALLNMRVAYAICVRREGKASRATVNVGTQAAHLLNKLGKHAEAEALSEELLAQPSVPASYRNALQLSLGIARMGQGRFREAEEPLRECLALRTRRDPGGWARWNAMSILGECLVGLQRFDEAERLLLESYEKLDPPPTLRQMRRRQARERVVKLYEAWGKPEKAEAWRLRGDADED